MCQHWKVKKDAYHHGDLRTALLDTGMQLLREGGPAALAAREATRKAGVSVTALYRHFDGVDQWRAEVSQAAREGLARSLQSSMAAVSARGTRPSIAAKRFRAAGEGYVRFAIEEPMLFSGAFIEREVSASRPDNPSPWDILESALDELVINGLLTPKRRTSAPTIAWTSVHGLATLIVQGVIDAKSTEDERVQIVLDAVREALGM